LLCREDVPIGTVAILCDTQPGADAFLAAGGLPPTVELLRSAAPGVDSLAVAALFAVANESRAVMAQLAADPAAAAALTPLLQLPPASGGGGTGLTSARPFMAATLLSALAAGARAPRAAGEAERNPVVAAVVRGGGMAHAVELLRGVVEGGGELGYPLADAHCMLNAMVEFCGDAAAARAAHAAGALPLALRAAVAAGRGPAGPRAIGTLSLALACLVTLADVSPANDVPLVAAQPALPAALSRALELAAAPQAGPRGAPAAAASTQVPAQHFARTAARLLGQMLSGPGRGGGAAASSFARAGGATHLVSFAAPPGVPLARHRQRASWYVQLDVRARLLGSPRAWLAHGVLANVAGATQRPAPGLGRPIPPASDTLARAQVSLLRAPLPDELRRDVLAAVSGVAVYAEARRALVAAGAAAAPPARRSRSRRCWRPAQAPRPRQTCAASLPRAPEPAARPPGWPPWPLPCS
jgi:hypothetical protein